MWKYGSVYNPLQDKFDDFFHIIYFIFFVYGAKIDIFFDMSKYFFVFSTYFMYFCVNNLYK